MAGSVAPAPAPVEEIGGTIERRLRSGGMWVGFWRIMGLALAFAVNLALPRLLTAEDFGRFTLILSILTFISVIARGGLDRAVIRLVGEATGLGDRRRAKDVLTMVSRCLAWTLPITAGLGALAVAWGAEPLFDLPSPGLIGGLVGVGILLLACLQMQAATLRSFHELRFAGLFDTQASGPAVNGVFLLLLAGSWWMMQPSLGGVIGLYLAALALLIPAAFYCVRITVRKWGLTRSPEAVEPAVRSTPLSDSAVTLTTLLGTAFPLLAVQLLTFASTQGDVWVAGARASEDDLALLSAVRRLMQFVAIPLLIVNSTVVSSIPALYAQGDLAALQRVLRRSATLAALPSALVLLALCAFPGELLALLFGPFYRAGAAPLVVLCMGQLIYTWTGSCGNVLAMTGRHQSVMWVMLASTVVLIVGGSWAAGRYGVTGLAVVSAGLTAITNLILWLLARRWTGVWTHAGLGPVVAIWKRRV